MALEVDTKDCTALADAELAEMADIVTDGPAGFDIGLLSKQREEWVLITQVREAGKLLGFSFCTLERIGGTPCLLWGLASVKRNAKRDQVLKALIADQFRRAVLAFPDEDVLVGTRFIDPGAFAAFKGLEDICPRPGHKADRRGAGLEPAAGQALRGRGPHRRPDLRGDRRRLRRAGSSTSARPSPRRVRCRGGRLLRAPRPRAPRRAHRLRLGHGRGPGLPLRLLRPAGLRPERLGRGRGSLRAGGGPLRPPCGSGRRSGGEGHHQPVASAAGHPGAARRGPWSRPGGGPGTAAP